MKSCPHHLTYSTSNYTFVPTVITLPYLVSWREHTSLSRILFITTITVIVVGKTDGRPFKSRSSYVHKPFVIMINSEN